MHFFLMSATAVTYGRAMLPYLFLVHVNSILYYCRAKRIMYLNFNYSPTPFIYKTPRARLQK
jgi:hypothetical protein